MMERFAKQLAREKVAANTHCIMLVKHFLRQVFVLNECETMKLEFLMGCEKPYLRNDNEVNVPMYFNPRVLKYLKSNGFKVKNIGYNGIFEVSIPEE